MKWKLKSIIKETNHRFLNYYSAYYEVINDDKEMEEYIYRLASRKEKTCQLRAVTEDFDRPDAVMVGCYKIVENKIYFLLEKQYRPALNRTVVSFPAGLMDNGDQSPLETAAREVKEETGYDVGKMEILVPPSPTSEGLSDECNAVVLAELKDKGRDDKEEFEDIDVKLFSNEEVEDLILNFS